MPLYRLNFTRDAFVQGEVVIEAASEVDAIERAEAAAGKHGLDLDKLGVDDIVWDMESVDLLENVDFIDIEPIGTLFVHPLDAPLDDHVVNP